MIITIKVAVVRGMYCEADWSATIELDEDTTLEDLHFVIQDAVGFDEDHLYCFFLSRTDRSRDRKYFDDDNGLIYDTTLKNLFPLPDKRSLYYLFDWGDNWIFKISLSRKRPHEPVQGVEYPRVVQETGVRPEQYPSEDFDDE
ncbi:MAG: IS1096 element passenger TnpR family protein [Aureliella sp.]